MIIRLPVIGALNSKRSPVLKRLFKETARRYAWRYLIAFVFLGVGAAATAGIAWLLRDFVNEIFVGRKGEYLPWLVGAVVFLSLAKGISGYVSEATLSSIGNRIAADSQMRMFRHILTLDVSYFAATRSSEVINRVGQNALDTRSLVNTIATAYGRDVLTLIALLLVMLVQQPLATLVALAIGPVMIFTIGRIASRLRANYHSTYTAMSRVVGNLQQVVQGIRVVKAYDLGPLLTDRMTTAVNENRKRLNRIGRLMGLSNPLSEVVIGLAIAGIIFWGGYSVIHLGQEPGQFISFLASVMLAYDPAKRLSRNHLMVEQGMVGVKLMYELLDMRPTVSPNAGAPGLKVDRGELRFDKVSFGYDPALPLLEGLSFRAAPGVTTALVGPSGSGKSTVMALIERFWDPESGSVLIDGQDIAKVEIGSLRRSIAYVSQESVLIDGSIADNIGLGRPSASRVEIEEAAKAAVVHDFIAGLPQGYDTRVGELGANFSGGQRQRIAIARAILRDAPIVLLDEATSALDAESEHAIQLAFDRLMRGRTTIVVAHRLSTVLHADRIFVMNEGRIVEEGRHADLMALDGLYARLYRLQFDPSLRVGAEPVAG